MYWVKLADGPCKGDYERSFCESYVIMLVTAGLDAGHYANYRLRESHKENTHGGETEIVRKKKPDGIFYFHKILKDSEPAIESHLRHERECNQHWEWREQITRDLRAAKVSGERG
jgi:hypothetical protein